MKSELFVINSVKSSEQAFSAVAELIASLNVRDLLKILQRPDKLRQAAANLHVKYEEVFAHLEKAIVEAFNRRIVSQLTRDHLRLLQTPDVQYELSKLFDCEPNAALQTLFSVPSMQETLESLSARSASVSDAAQLLNEILQPGHAQQLEFDYATTQNDWEPIVDGEQWLLPSAARTLTEQVESSDRITPCRALAEFIDKTRNTKSETKEVYRAQPDVVGPLALIEFRRRLMWILESLRQEIIECGERAAATMPASPSVQLLLPVVQMYEFGNVAQGLRSYINQGQILRDLLPENSISTPGGIDEEKVVQERPLIFSSSSKYGVAGDQVWSFEILCFVSDQRQPQKILQVSDVKAWVYRQLSQDIPTLRPDQLSVIGDQLHERLLNTSFPLLDPQTERLKQAIDRLDLAFIRAVVLCCETPLDRIPDLFRGELSQRLPYKELPSLTDPSYPKGVEDIIAVHRAGYQNSLRIERGTGPSDSSTQT